MASVTLPFVLECTVCFEVPKVDTRIFQCNNGHIFCLNCYTKLTLCPTCRKRLVSALDNKHENGPIRCLAVENIIRQCFANQTLALTPSCIEEARQLTDIPMSKSPTKNKLTVLGEIEKSGDVDGHFIARKTQRQNGFNVGRLGSTENAVEKAAEKAVEYMMETNPKYGVYWGRRLPK